MNTKREGKTALIFMCWFGVIRLTTAHCVRFKIYWTWGMRIETEIRFERRGHVTECVLCVDFSKRDENKKPSTLFLLLLCIIAKTPRLHRIESSTTQYWICVDRNVQIREHTKCMHFKRDDTTREIWENTFFLLRLPSIHTLTHTKIQHIRAVLFSPFFSLSVSVALSRLLLLQTHSRRWFYFGFFFCHFIIIIRHTGARKRATETAICKRRMEE